MQRGREKPAKEVSKRGFREEFVKAVIEDDLPYSFGEGQGMSRCFRYVLPKGYNIPNGKMVRRDLDILHSKMEEKVNATIEVMTDAVQLGECSVTDSCSN